MRASGNQVAIDKKPIQEAPAKCCCPIRLTGCSWGVDISDNWRALSAVNVTGLDVKRA